MLAKRLVPCLDVDRGRVVKGVRFVSLRDAGDPVECAARYDAEGADELVFLDITASADARPIVIDMVRRVADAVFLPFTVGGGVRSVEDADGLLRAGAASVVGVDISEEACDNARQKYGIDARCGSAEAIPLPDASVDVVVSFETIEHVPDAEALVLEIRRVLVGGAERVAA